MDRLNRAARKARSIRILAIHKTPGFITPRMIGHAAAQHNTCNCPACTYKEPQHLRKQARDDQLFNQE